MCYDRRRAEACVDESAHHALANAGGREIFLIRLGWFLYSMRCFLMRNVTHVRQLYHSFAAVDSIAGRAGCARFRLASLPHAARPHTLPVGRARVE